MARHRRRKKNPADWILRVAVLGVVGLGVYLGVTGKTLPQLLAAKKDGTS